MRITAITSAYILSLLGLLAACSPHQYVDDDDLCSRAKPLPPIVLVKDELNVNMGDVADCKQVKYFKDAVARVEYRIGTAFEKHDMKGLITVYNAEGQVLDQKAVDPSMFLYDFEFDVVAQRPYYVEFKATAGNYAYQSQVQFQKKDPCAKCGPDQECVDSADGGKVCRDPVQGCDPPCDEEQGLICSQNECVNACNPPCRSGYTCDVETRECVREQNRCNPACKRGYYCSRGRCRQKQESRQCKGGCPPGQVCQSGACVKPGGVQVCPACPNVTDICSRETNYKCVGSGDDEKTGPIVGRLTSTTRAGNGTVLYVNRGTRNGVKRGQRGSLCGKFKFMITNAFATRAKANTSHTIEEIGDCKSVVISR